MEIITKEQLTKWFNTFNAEYFESQLPNVEIKISKSERLLGCITWNKFDKKIYNIKISDCFIREEKEYQTTLLHEMIHLFEIIKYGKATHGVTFKSKANEIYLKSCGKYIITRQTEIGGNVKYNDKYNIQELIIICKKDNEYRITKTKPTRLINDIELLIKRNYQIVDNGYILKQDCPHIATNRNSVHIYCLPDNLAIKLLDKIKETQNMKKVA